MPFASSGSGKADPHVKRALLLMAYGGPDSLADVEPYLLDVRGGRPTSPELTKEIRDRYALIGGRSPLLERTREQAAALEARLARDAERIPVYVGMRHWHPYIAETFRQIVADGVTHLTAIAMAPQYARMSVGAYIRKVEEAQQSLGSNVDVTFVKSWHDHPLFLEAVAERVRQAVGDDLSSFEVIFTAHSLPERILQDGDPYATEFLESADGVARILGLPRWHWGYQSAGSTTDRWLGPDVSVRLQELAAEGWKRVVIVPLGFVCDHIEILYDVDMLYRDQAKALGLELRRTESLNAFPPFIEALAAIARGETRE